MRKFIGGPSLHASLILEFPLNPRFHLVELVTGILPLPPGPADRVAGKAWNDMPVAVIDNLTGGGTVVDDHVEPLRGRRFPDRTAEPGQERADVSGQIIGKVAQLDMMGPGHDQAVPGIERVDVEEGHGQIGLEHASRRDLAADDLAEEAVRVVWRKSHGGALPGWATGGLRLSLSGVRRGRP